MAKRKKSKASSKSSLTPWIIGAAVLFIVLIIVTVVLSGGGTSVSIEPPDVPEGYINGTVLGDPNAPVTVQAWEDFLCPACGDWARTIEPQLVEDYVKSGDVKLEFHQFPLQMHAPGAQMGAQASECAADQEMFWPYHDRLFAEAASRGQTAFQLERLVEYANEFGMDEDAFRQCMIGQTHRAAVDASVNEAVTMGLNSTPSVLVNGQLVQPFDYNAMKEIIDAVLAESSGG